MSYIEGFTEILQKKGRRFELVDGKLFVRKEQWIVPFGPAAKPYSLSPAQRKMLLLKLGGLWVQWTDGFGPHADNSEWYAVICRCHTPINVIESGNTRSKLRRGLKNCEVRKVDAEEIATQGYETYCAAINSYQGNDTQIPTEADFQRRVRSDAPFADIRHQWAVYHQDKLIAFAQNLIYDKIEVDYTLIKLHPDYLKFYPAYALIYKMNEYYLAEQGFQYVNDGFRSILHQTGIQEFLIKKFGFEKAPTGLYLHFRPPYGQILRLARPFRRPLARFYPKAGALFELDRLGRQAW